MPQTKVPPPITRADYEGMPEGPPYFQVIDGDLIMSPSPNTFHQHIAINIVRLIGDYLEQHPLGEVLIAPTDVFLTDTNVYQPDVLFVANDRLSQITNRGVEGAPNLVVEILSDSTARYDQGLKRKIYSRTGVQELWLVHPDTRTLQIYNLDQDAEAAVTYDETSTFESRLLPGLKIRAQRIFRPLRRP